MTKSLDDLKREMDRDEREAFEMAHRQRWSPSCEETGTRRLTPHTRQA